MPAKTKRTSIVSKAALVRLRRAWRTQRKRVVFTNGVFDILHRGHVELLDEARSLGDILVVGLNSDASVRRLKGLSRPINSQRDRAAVLLALRSVDYVCAFGEDTPFNLIRALQPDFLVKGAEYGRAEIVGADIVIESGGTVRRIRMRKGYSTSDIIRRAHLRK